MSEVAKARIEELDVQADTDLYSEIMESLNTKVAEQLGQDHSPGCDIGTSPLSYSKLFS